MLPALFKTLSVTPPDGSPVKFCEAYFYMAGGEKGKQFDFNVHCHSLYQFTDVYVVAFVCGHACMLRQKESYLDFKVLGANTGQNFCSKCEREIRCNERPFWWPYSFYAINFCFFQLRF